MISSPQTPLTVFREKKDFFTLCLKQSDSVNIQFNCILLLLLIKCVPVTQGRNLCLGHVGWFPCQKVQPYVPVSMAQQCRCLLASVCRAARKVSRYYLHQFFTGEKSNLGVISFCLRGRPQSCLASPGECSPQLSAIPSFIFFLHCIVAG